MIPEMAGSRRRARVQKEIRFVIKIIEDFPEQ